MESSSSYPDLYGTEPTSTYSSIPNIHNPAEILKKNVDEFVKLLTRELNYPGIIIDPNLYAEHFNLIKAFEVKQLPPIDQVAFGNLVRKTEKQLFSAPKQRSFQEIAAFVGFIGLMLLCVVRAGEKAAHSVFPIAAFGTFAFILYNTNSSMQKRADCPKEIRHKLAVKWDNFIKLNLPMCPSQS